MSLSTQFKRATRLRRKKHIRKVVQGTTARPRLVVYRSLKQIYVQLVDDVAGKVLFGLSSRSPSVRERLADTQGKVQSGRLLGKALAALAKEKGVDKVVFDRNGYLYHGRVKAVAEGAREGGLSF